MNLWHIATGEPTGFCNEHHAHIFNCHLADDGQIITASNDGTLRFWDASKSYVSRGCVAARWGVGTSCSAFNIDGSRIVTGSWDGTLFVTDTRNGDCLQELKTQRNAVLCVAFAPDGLSIAAATADGSLRIWDAATGECTRVLEAGQIYLNRFDNCNVRPSCAFSSDSAHVVFGHSNVQPRLWNVATGECLTAVDALMMTMMTTAPAFKPQTKRSGLARIIKTPTRIM